MPKTKAQSKTKNHSHKRSLPPFVALFIAIIIVLICQFLEYRYQKYQLQVQSDKASAYVESLMNKLSIQFEKDFPGQWERKRYCSKGSVKFQEPIIGCTQDLIMKGSTPPLNDIKKSIAKAGTDMKEGKTIVKDVGNVIQDYKPTIDKIGCGLYHYTNNEGITRFICDFQTASMLYPEI